ncbi:MAG TPA: hypothetical protein VII40_09720 [Xanthobacteraceae bacterium]
MRDPIAPVLGRDPAERPIKAVFAIERFADMLSLRPLLGAASWDCGHEKVAANAVCSRAIVRGSGNIRR